MVPPVPPVPVNFSRWDLWITEGLVGPVSAREGELHGSFPCPCILAGRDYILIGWGVRGLRWAGLGEGRCDFLLG